MITHRCRLRPIARRPILSNLKDFILCISTKIYRFSFSISLVVSDASSNGGKSFPLTVFIATSMIDPSQL